jgi:O-antigen/teichoic acid export membrane protein
MIYSLAPFTMGLSGLFLVPVFARLFEAAEFGVLDTVLAFTATVASFLVFGMDASAGLYYFDKQEEANRPLILSTGLVFLCVVGLAACVMLGFFAADISKLVLKDESYKDLFLIAFLAIPFQVLTRYLPHVLRWQRERVKFLSVQILPLFVRVGLSIYLAIIFGLKGALWGAVIAFMFVAVLAFFFGRKNYTLKLSFRYLKKLLSCGVFFPIVSLVIPLIFLIDRVLIVNFHSLSQVGYYTGGLKIAAIYGLIIGGFRQAWGPLAFSKWEEKDFGLFYAKMVTYYVLVGSILILGIGIFSRELVSIILTSDYIASSSIVAILCIGWMMFDLYKLFGIGIFYTKKSHFFAIGSSVGLGLAILLDILLIPHLGIIGAAIANTIAKGSIVVVVFFFSQRLLHIRYEWSKMALIILLTFLALYLAGITEDLLSRALIFLLTSLSLPFFVWRRPYQVLIKELKVRI